MVLHVRPSPSYTFDYPQVLDIGIKKPENWFYQIAGATKCMGLWQWGGAQRLSHHASHPRRTGFYRDNIMHPIFWLLIRKGKDFVQWTHFMMIKAMYFLIICWVLYLLQKPDLGLLRIMHTIMKEHWCLLHICLEHFQDILHRIFILYDEGGCVPLGVFSRKNIFSFLSGCQCLSPFSHQLCQRC